MGAHNDADDQYQNEQKSGQVFDQLVAGTRLPSLFGVRLISQVDYENQEGENDE